MIRRRHALPLLVAALAGTASPGRASPATAEEAGRLTALLQTYAGAPAPGTAPAVTVSSQGDGYRAAIDLSRLAAPLHAFDIDLVATEPLVLTLTPLADGTWRVLRGSLPRVGITTRKGFTYSIEFDGATTEGIFDPHITAFRHQDSTSGTTRASITDGTYAQRSESVHHGRQAVDAQGPNPGDVSSTLHDEDADITYRSHGASVGPTSTRADLDVALTVRAMTTDLAATHENVASLLAMWAFLVAHPTRAQLIAEQPRLRELALAMLPYVASLAARSELKGLNLDVNGGKASLDALSQRLVLGAEEATDALAVQLKLTGLKVSATQQMPGWIGTLLPENVTLDLQTTPLDVASALRVLVRRADLAAPEVVPADAVAEALAQLARGGALGLRLKPSAVSNGVLELAGAGAYDGAASTATLHVEAAGLDKEVALIGREDDPLAAQVEQALSAAYALGKPLPNGRLAWDIRVSPTIVTVNGAPLR